MVINTYGDKKDDNYVDNDRCNDNDNNSDAGSEADKGDNIITDSSNHKKT